MLEQEENTNKANTTALNLLDQLKDADAEIERLKEYIDQLKSHTAQYIPVKGDHIDEALAEFINTF
jgi:archaellum component FlaC